MFQVPLHQLTRVCGDHGVAIAAWKRGWTRKLRSGTAAIVLAGMVLGGHATVWAQPEAREGRRGMRGGMGGPGGDFFREMSRLTRGEPLRRSDIERAADELGLTVEQETAAMTLLEGYEDRLRTMREEQQQQREAAMTAMRESGDASGLEALREGQRTTREKQAAMETQLLADVRAVLTPDQDNKWTGVEAGVRRDQRLRRGIMAGERLNVREVVRGLEMSPAELADADAILQQYDVEIDRELSSRERLLDEPLPDMRGLRTGEGIEDIRKAMTQRRDAMVKVRDVNKRFARQVQEALPDGVREAFAQRVQQATYPDIYRPTSGAEALQRASSMKDLTPEQLDQVVRLEERYKETMAQWTPKAVKAWDELESQFTPDRIGGGADAWRGMGDGAGVLRQERRELDRTTLSELKKILTPEQAKQLPEIERDDNSRERRRPRVV